MKEKLTREYFETEMKTAETQINRFSAVRDLCKWILENKEIDGEGQKEPDNVKTL